MFIIKVVYQTVNSPLISYTFIIENKEIGLNLHKKNGFSLIFKGWGGAVSGLYPLTGLPWFISPPTHLQQIPFLYRDLFGISSTTFMNHLHHPKTKVQTLSAGVHIMA